MKLKVFFVDVCGVGIGVGTGVGSGDVGMEGAVVVWVGLVVVAIVVDLIVVGFM